MSSIALLGRDRIERGIGHVGDMEHEALGFLVAGGARRHALRCAEHRFDELRRHEAAGLAALQIGCGLHLRPASLASWAKAVPALSLPSMSFDLACSRLAISSSRQRAATWSLTSSSVRSRDGVMPVTSN